MTRKLFQPISKEEFDKLFAVAKEDREKHRMKRSKKLTVRGERINDFMIAMLLGFYSGLRISEIVGYIDRVPALNSSRIEGNWIRVVSGKGGKDRLTPKPRLLSQVAIRALPLKARRRALQRYVTELGPRVLQKKITFHTLRHGFVTHCLEKGIAIHVVQSWAGHSRLDTTGLYAHVLKPEKHMEQYKEVFG